MPPILRLLRPTHWTKNLAALAGVIFGGRLGEPESVLLNVAVTGLFILSSAAVYAFNDLRDVELDRRHATKRHRPIAAGEVSTTTAGILAGALALASIVGAAMLGSSTLVCISTYLVINLLYSVWLKHVALVDVMCIALGYCLRVLASIYVLGDIPTAWIVLCTFFLALFLGFGKRRAEAATHENAEQERPVLDTYDLPMLDFLLSSSATMSVMTYALFTATSGKNPSLIITVPVVYFAVMHYRRLVQTSAAAEEPDQIILKDRAIQLSIVLWLLCFVAIFYGQFSLFR